MDTIIFKYKKSISIVLTLCVQILMLYFIFNYSIKTWIFNALDDSSSKGKDTQVYFDDNLPIKLQEQEVSKEKADQEDMTSRPVKDLQLEAPSTEPIEQKEIEESDESQDIAQDQDISKDISEDIPQDASQDTKDIKEDIDQIDIPRPISAIPIPIEEYQEARPERKVRRIVRKVVRRKRQVYNPLTQANILNTVRQLQQEKVNANAKLGEKTKYKHVTERLERMRYYSYKCNVHKTLKAEFIKHRQPIAFDEDFEYQIEANLIISSDGSVKFEYKNPTGHKEFDDYITFVLNQTKLPPMPAWAKGQTLVYPFNPKLIAKKGTHFYRYYGPGPESF